ncbi:MAG: penicillin acylase family protein [Candidatus Acidiferrales bacterium]
MNPLSKNALLPLLVTFLILVPCWRSEPAQLGTESASTLREQARSVLAQTSGRLEVPGLEQPVEVLRDSWGVPHIYAKSQHDLFFAQGFVAAQDRLWQLDLWRRKAEGRLAEILGPAAVERDRYARLLRYRGDMEVEWKSYSPDARQIVEAFAQGINAYIALLGDNLPLEFKLLGLRPEAWKPEVCLSRLAAYPLAGNAELDLLRAELVHRLGAERAAQLLPPDPPQAFQVPAGLSLEGIDPSLIAGLEAAAGRVELPAPEGSNNWALAGARTETGKPILANDPHRELTLPSLRYIVHLVGPGWNAIGAGEPALPGISIGHNQRIAFGLTVFAADQQDVYVETLRASDPTLYADPTSSTGWSKLVMLEEEIRVRGEPQPRRVQLKFTRHGPVIHEDATRQRAYVLRWVGTEPGTAGYLAGLAISRAQNWREFRRALERWKLPPENFVYADIEGNIGYQASGLVPNRVRGDGLLPVLGSSNQDEWRGFRRLNELPHEFNPARHYVATANHKVLVVGERRVFGFDWSSPYRIDRIREVLNLAQGHTVSDSQRLQADVASLPARELLKLLDQIPSENPRRAEALGLLRTWDAVLEKESAAAVLYEVWLAKLREAVFRPQLPDDLWQHARASFSLPTLLRALRESDPAFFGSGSQPRRNQVLAQSLDDAIAELESKQGPEMSHWRWGALHTAEFKHPLASTPARAQALNRGPVERAGDANSVNSTSGASFRQTHGASFRQTHGASFREVIDLEDWDRSLASNVPGQSGQPESPHYDDLLELWARDSHFPLLYSRDAVEKNSRERLLLVPAGQRKD